MARVFHSMTLDREFLVQLESELKKNLTGDIAVKIHFGEPGNNYALTPGQVKPIFDILDRLKINYFLFDSSVSYPSPRCDPKKHREVAEKKGWKKVKTNDDF